MKRVKHTRLMTLLLALGLAASAPVFAEDIYGGYAGAPPSAAAMGFDFLLVRPVSFAATAVGTVLFVGSLPFSLLGSNTGEAAQQLVARPAQYTFVRPLGEFQDGFAP